MTGTEELGAGVDTPTAPAPRRKTWILLLACAAVAMANLDAAIVNIALPSIQSEFRMGQGSLQWVVVAYGLLLGGFLIVGGRMTDRIGRRGTFITGVTIMAASSLAAGLAQIETLLFVARGGQGFGAALLVPAALSLVAVTFEDGAERHRAIATFGAVGGVAGTLGVVVGGILTAGPGWRWAFFINVPMAAILVIASIALLPHDRDRDRTARIDVLGASAVTAGLLLAVYGLHHASGHGWLAGSTLVVIAGAVVLLLVFARLEARSAAPLVPHSMWRSRRTVVANLAGFFSMSALLGFIYLGTLFMQRILGYSPIETGLAWLTTTVTVFVAAMAGGRMASVVGIRSMLLTGLGLVVVGALLLARVSAHTEYLTGLVPAFILAGIGFGLCGPAVQLAALAGVADSDAGLAAGLVETMREIGGAAGVAIVTTVLVTDGGLDGFQSSFTVIAVLALAGGVVTAVGLRRTAM